MVDNSKKLAISGPADSAILPVPWAPALMRNRKDGHVLTNDLIHNGVWEMPEVIVPRAIFVFGPTSKGFTES